MNGSYKKVLRCGIWTVECKGLADAKGYITHGEEELVPAWKTELPKATHLWCIRNFEANCKQKLCEIGI